MRHLLLLCVISACSTGRGEGSIGINFTEGAITGSVAMTFVDGPASNRALGGEGCYLPSGGPRWISAGEITVKTRTTSFKLLPVEGNDYPSLSVPSGEVAPDVEVEVVGSGDEFPAFKISGVVPQPLDLDVSPPLEDGISASGDTVFTWAVGPGGGTVTVQLVHAGSAGVLCQTAYTNGVLVFGAAEKAALVGGQGFTVNVHVARLNIVESKIGDATVRLFPAARRTFHNVEILP